MGVGVNLTWEVIMGNGRRLDNMMMTCNKHVASSRGIIDIAYPVIQV